MFLPVLTGVRVLVFICVHVHVCVCVFGVYVHSLVSVCVFDAVIRVSKEDGETVSETQVHTVRAMIYCCTMNGEKQIRKEETRIQNVHIEVVCAEFNKPATSQKNKQHTHCILASV